jgi:hypothetical protein
LMAGMLKDIQVLACRGWWEPLPIPK